VIHGAESELAVRPTDLTFGWPEPATKLDPLAPPVPIAARKRRQDVRASRIGVPPDREARLGMKRRRPGIGV
jgi:hypothetical protein